MPAADQASRVQAAGHWAVHCDGSAAPNPGRMGLGVVLVSPGGVMHQISVAAEGRGCNNEAELRALMAALTALQQHGATAALVHCDNSVVVRQLVGPGAPAIERLTTLFNEARALLQTFASVRLVWVPRHRNREADVLARAALGLAPKAPAGVKKRRK